MKVGMAIYGKGGIGKSTVAANVAAALAESGKEVLLVGCDPKADTTLPLLGERSRTVLDAFRSGRVDRDDVVHEGDFGVLCVESGGPEPGVGCAGRGVLKALQTLEELGVFDDVDVVIYDVLGDVVCGGFAMPLRHGYADVVFVVTSPEPMAIYAANNICKGVANHAKTGGAKLGGLVNNARAPEIDPYTVKEFASEVGVDVIYELPFLPEVRRAEAARKTVIAAFPDSEAADVFRELADLMLRAEGTVPEPLPDERLFELIESSAVPEYQEAGV